MTQLNSERIPSSISNESSIPTDIVEGRTRVLLFDAAFKPIADITRCDITLYINTYQRSIVCVNPEIAEILFLVLYVHRKPVYQGSWFCESAFVNNDVPLRSMHPLLSTTTSLYPFARLLNFRSARLCKKVLKTTSVDEEQTPTESFAFRYEDLVSYWCFIKNVERSKHREYWWCHFSIDNPVAFQ